MLACSLLLLAYSSFEDLKKHERPQVDYKITVENRLHSTSIVAIHGGKIEIGTSEIAQAIANASNFNLYLFEGIKASNNGKLHITSRYFDEPNALELALYSRHIVSIHGLALNTKSICIGGLNARLRKLFHSALKEALPADVFIEEPCRIFPGIQKQNIVNLALEQGVQLEFSLGLRLELLNNPKLLNSVAQASKAALEQL